MEEGQKKIVSIVFFIICISAAAGIVYKTYFSNKGLSKEGRRTTMKCSKCGFISEMDVLEFQEEWDALRAETSPLAPAIFTCPKCGKKAFQPARTCPKCGEIFIEDMFSQDYADRCPKCGYSPAEEARKR